MMRFNNIKMLAAAVMASACAFVSCVEMEQQESAVGYLDAPSLEVDVTIEEMTQIKALEIGIPAPAPSEIHYVVRDKDGNVKYDDDGLWIEPLVLPTGGYTVEAYYGSNGFGAPYFSGSATGSITALGREVPALTLSLANSLLCIEVDPEFADHFDVGSSKAVLKSGSASAYVSYGEWLYVPSGEDLEVTMTGMTAGDEVSLTHSLPDPSPKVAYHVICKKSTTSWPSVEWVSTSLGDGAFEGKLYFSGAVPNKMSDENKMKLEYQIKGGSYSDWTPVDVSEVGGYKCISGLSNDTQYTLKACVGAISSVELPFTPVSFESCLSCEASAAHNNTSDPVNVMLENTIVSAAVNSDLPSIVRELATVTATASFENSQGVNMLKTETIQVDAGKKNLVNDDGWPYLPNGAYTFRSDVKCVLPDFTIQESVSASVTVPKPVFSVFINAYTSYDKYAGTNGNSKDVNAANSIADPSAMYDIAGGAKISVALLDNPSYGEKHFVMEMYHSDTKTTEKLSEVRTDKGFGTNVAAAGTRSSLSWGQHDLTVSMTFDGVTVTRTQNHYITGLPYDLVDNTCKDRWTLNGGGTAEWQDATIHLNHSYNHTATLQFYIPDPVTILMDTSFSIYTPSRLAKPKLTISSGGTDLGSIEGKTGTAVTADFSEQYSGSLSNSDPSVRFTREYKYNREGDVWIRTLKISYGE